MTLLPKPSTSQVAGRCADAHPRCVVCSPTNVNGLRLECTAMPDGSVQGDFPGGVAYEGYVGRLHGGVIAALLDGAMTQCLFAYGCQGFTAQLTVRYRHPVATGEAMTVHAWLTDSHAPLHYLRAELRQNGQVRVTALGKFIETHP